MYYFASDVHLGLKNNTDTREREQLFVKWLDEVSADAKAILLVGDIFDFWYEYKRVIPKGHSRLLGKLSELTDKGIEIHHFDGNHDLWAYSYLEEECGVKLHHTAYETIELYGHRILIGHGDVIGKRSRSMRMLSGIFRNRTVQWFFNRIPHNLGIWLGNTWSRSSRNSKPLKREFRGENERLVQFAREYLLDERIDLFVFGHIHIANIYQLNNESSVAFLGEWVESPTYGVMSKEGFTLKNYPNIQ